MKKFLVLTVAVAALSACTEKDVTYDYNYPHSPQYNMRERSHNYWYHGDQNAKCDSHKKTKKAAIKEKK